MQALQILSHLEFIIGLVYVQVMTSKKTSLATVNVLFTILTAKTEFLEILTFSHNTYFFGDYLNMSLRTKFRITKYFFALFHIISQTKVGLLSTAI